MGISTISGIVKEVCQAIWVTLKDEVLKFPNEHSEWIEIATGFEKNTNFPQCVGALDGKHIRMIMPQHTASLDFNYKGYFSIVLLAMCDANYNFKYINVGAPGKNSDAGIFRESSLMKKIENGTINLPPSKTLPGMSTAVPYVILGDEAFGIARNILRPYARKNLNYKKKIFNYRQCRARRMIESTFGILTNKFRIFHRPLNVNTDLAIDIVKCCCALHNFIRVRDGYQHQDTLVIHGLADANNSILSTHTGNDVRDHYANYFISEAGRVEWQDYCIS